VLRRYDQQATRADVAYEHTVLWHAAAAGWVVPVPLTDVVEVDGRLYCATQFVPGAPIANPDGAMREERGRTLARLELDLRPLAEDVGQRPGWRPLHEDVTVHVAIDWRRAVSEFRAVDGRLADWTERAGEATRSPLSTVGAEGLPVTVVHGDFAEWNVHYDERGRLAGVIDFGLAHLDSRPFELAIARAYRAPETVWGFREEPASLGWPLTELEEAAMEPMQRAFRVDMAVWAIDHGFRTGTFDLAWIERQLERTGVRVA
jgi:Ser/Thr protein kinase RdoA (MazF antagonist)